MKKIFSVTLLILLQVLFIYNPTLSQNSIDPSTQFENNLFTTIQLKDSIPKKYNIYDRMKLRKTPAVAITVIKNGKIVLNNQYGFADYENKAIADSSTLFHFASIAKTANAVCVMKLAEEGKLSLSADFREYIKDGSFIETKFSKGEKITIANLLSHTAGINRDDGPSGDYSHEKPIPSITQIIKGEKPATGDGAYSVRKPNETYEYSNQAIALIQKILNDNFDSDYNRLLTSTIFNPLKMHQSTFALKLDSVQEKKLAHGYIFDYQQVPPWVFPCQAQGGLISSAEDVARLVIAIQNACNEIDTTFLKKSTAQAMLSPQLGPLTYTGSLNIPYKNGLGVMLFEKGERKYFTHSGSVDGYTSIYVGSMDGIDGAVVIINSSYAAIISEIINSIATTFAWKNYVEHNYKTTVVVNDDLLNKYVGVYNMQSKNGTFTSAITKIGNQLYIQTSDDGAPEPLYFSATNEAFILSRAYKISFAAEGKKQILNLTNNGNYSGKLIKVN